MCTKNLASYDRRAKRRRQDTENLAQLADWRATGWFPTPDVRTGGQRDFVARTRPVVLGPGPEQEAPP